MKIADENLYVNDKFYGPLQPNQDVLVDEGTVHIAGKEVAPKPEPAG